MIQCTQPADTDSHLQAHTQAHTRTHAQEIEGILSETENAWGKPCAGGERGSEAEILS